MSSSSSLRPSWVPLYEKEGGGLVAAVGGVHDLPGVAAAFTSPRYLLASPPLVPPRSSVVVIIYGAVVIVIVPYPSSVSGAVMHVGLGWQVPGSDRQQRGGEGTHNGGGGVVVVGGRGGVVGVTNGPTWQPKVTHMTLFTVAENCRVITLKFKSVYGSVFGSVPGYSVL
ncbi:hypothetical protein CVT25_002171 [Psilocybe cyanescens]|uniref:Uncharacterized protein n=1 Tax=Psilocybe cyanescens TaxID=93625 RepID=A0A409XF55_PSICY|nr:hypothetical protein CVT25_002171 [Psilocybe cyanescens]